MCHFAWVLAVLPLHKKNSALLVLHGIWFVERIINTLELLNMLKIEMSFVSNTNIIKLAKALLLQVNFDAFLLKHKFSSFFIETKR